MSISLPLPRLPSRSLCDASCRWTVDDPGLLMGGLSGAASLRGETRKPPQLREHWRQTHILIKVIFWLNTSLFTAPVRKKNKAEEKKKMAGAVLVIATLWVEKELCKAVCVSQEMKVSEVGTIRLWTFWCFPFSRGVVCFWNLNWLMF